MNAIGVLQTAYRQSDMVMQMMLGDVADGELLHRAGPHANHLAWQAGHLICSEHGMLSRLGAALPALPDGFAERHAADNAASDKPTDFETKERYLALFAEQRAATLAFVAELKEADLDAPGPEHLHRVAPTTGAALMLMALHQAFHVGQWAPVRRQLGKPNAF